VAPFGGKPLPFTAKITPKLDITMSFWKDGDAFGGRSHRLVKKCKYIPKRLLEKIEKLEVDKAPVRHILSIL
jgi:hypothetical protein